MRLLIASICVASLVLANQRPALAQKGGVEQLKREIELLKREIDLLKRENELLKQENAALKKGGTAKGKESESSEAPRVTVGGVEYVYLGMARSGANVLVTLLATSQNGDQLGPNGQMTLIDDEGEKYMAIPLGGIGAQARLREGVPTKLTWRFGPNPITGKSSAPSAKITRFAALSVEINIGNSNDTIEFRNVPVTVSKAKAK